jgi:Fic family protein
VNPEEFGKSPSGRLVKARTGYWAFVPAPLPPDLNWTSPLVSLLAEAERHLARLAALGGILPPPELLVQSFVRREAVLSSRIEGTRASLVDLYDFEAGQLELPDQPSDVREVHNYVRALNYGLDRLMNLPVSLRFIREIHKVLMEGVRGEHLTPGEFRRTQNWIGPANSTIETAPYVPPPVDEMLPALVALETTIHARSDLPLLVRAGLIHYQFEAIHPFLDGNGRIGRLLMILLLHEWKLLPRPLLYLSAYFESHRPEYYDRLLAVSQRGDWEGWLRFFLEAVSTEAEDASARGAQLQTLREQYQSLLRGERAAGRLLRALDVVFEHPVLSVRQMEAALEVPFLTAQRYVEKLERLGILREVTGRPRNRRYRADAILQVINRPMLTGESRGSA